MKKYTLFFVSSALVSGICQAHAAGYQLNEYSVTGLGRSFAGAGIVADDYSALAYNPAGMTLVQRSGLQTGVTFTEVASKAKGFEGQKTDMDFFVTLPSLMGQYNLNDKWFIGGGIYVPYGLATRYKHNSFIAKGKNGVKRSELEVVDFNLSGAYKASEHWSIGLSAILRRITGNLTSNLNYGTLNIGDSTFEVKGWTGTFHAGLMYEVNENTRFGLSYRHKSIQKTSGKHYVDINPNAPLYATYTLGQPALGATLSAADGRYRSASDPELPASLLFSAYHKFAPEWGTSASVRYTLWHTFKVFPGKTTDQALLALVGKKNLDVEYRWKNAWTISLGQDYYLNQNWTLRAGAAYDQSPSRSNTYRTNRIPDSDRIWLSFGASYQSKNYQIDFGYAHLFFMHGKTYNSHAQDVNAKYRSHSNMYGLNFQYKF